MLFISVVGCFSPSDISCRCHPFSNKTLTLLLKTWFHTKYFHKGILFNWLKDRFRLNTNEQQTLPTTEECERITKGKTKSAIKKEERTHFTKTLNKTLLVNSLCTNVLIRNYRNSSIFSSFPSFFENWAKSAHMSSNISMYFDCLKKYIYKLFYTNVLRFPEENLFREIFSVYKIVYIIYEHIYRNILYKFV